MPGHSVRHVVEEFKVDRWLCQIESGEGTKYPYFYNVQSVKGLFSCSTGPCNSLEEARALLDSILKRHGLVRPRIQRSLF